MISGGAGHSAVLLYCLFTVAALPATSAHELLQQGEALILPALPSDIGDGSTIREFLLDKEVPLVGGAWGLDLFVDAPLNDEPDGAEVTLRRSMVTYARRLTRDFSLRATGDYTRGGGLEASNTYLEWSRWQSYRLRFGITSAPFSLESMSSSSGLTFMERSLPVFAISERKSGGVELLHRNERNILNAKLILFNVDRDDVREDGQGVVVHYGFSPLNASGDRDLHLGTSFSYRWNASRSGSQFRSRPEVATVDDYYVDTGQIDDAERVGRWSFEASEVQGRFSWQAELLGLHVDRGDQPQLDFHGGYALASWFLTNDSRAYDAGDGRYARVRVEHPVGRGGWGGVEVAARASFIDLSDEDVIGGRQSNVSLGLNWYTNDRWRFMANLVKVLEVDRPGSQFDGREPLIFSLRVQLILR